MSVTEPSSDKELGQLFPGGKQMQCWDSKLDFRLTGDSRKELDHA
jgi:gamma-glutamylputrescine oxidase